MESIAICGVGLIGGSLGLALRKAGFTGPILGVSSPRTIEAAVALGAIDRGVSLEEAVRVADVIYLAQPIGGILSTLEDLGRMKVESRLITDAGSTKSAIVAKAAEHIKGCPFLGGHPMAGKASRGVTEADPDLFRNRRYVVTPDGSSDPTDAERGFLQWIAAIGSELVAMTPEQHDLTVAFTSHLPQLASTALATTVGSNLPEKHLTVSGPGLQDMTRLAQSSYEIWADILSTNSSAVHHALSVYIDKLTEMRNNLQTPGLSDDFRNGQSVSSQLRR